MYSQKLFTLSSEKNYNLESQIYYHKYIYGIAFVLMKRGFRLQNSSSCITKAAKSYLLVFTIWGKCYPSMFSLQAEGASSKNSYRAVAHFSTYIMFLLEDYLSQPAQDSL